MASTPGFGLRELVRAVSWRRRLLAAALAAASVALALQLLEPRPAPTTTVLAAARDLPGGHALGKSDVRELALPTDAVPAGALSPGDARATRMLAGPVRAGEPLTDVRMMGPALLASLDDQLVAAPVRMADAGALSLVRPGDRIDVLAAETDLEQAQRPARVVARAAPVLALPGRGPAGRSDGTESGLDTAVSGFDPAASDPAAVAGDGGLVVLAVPPDVAADLARAAVTARLSLVVRHSP